MLPVQTPNPDPVLIEDTADGAPWWEIVAALGPLAILVAAVITGVVALVNLRHRRQADQRSEWWARAQWALDSAISEDTSRQLQGFALLDHLARSDLAGPEEVRILETAWETILGQSSVDEAPGKGDNGETDAPAEEVQDEQDQR